MRTHLAKSLQTRCKTIKKAVEAYNTAAAALIPPHPALVWSRVSHYGFLDGFHLLEDTRNDIRSKPWAQPHIRRLMKIRQRVIRAAEETERCSVEVRRLHTSIRDEQAFFETRLAQLSGTLMHGAVKDYVTYRTNINERLINQIYDIYSVDGYVGIKGCGNWLGGAAAAGPDPAPRAQPDARKRGR